MNSSSLDMLATIFTPPDVPYHPTAPKDFSQLSLRHEPPQDLIDLLEKYGAGTFECASGDPVSLLFPTEQNAWFQNDLWEAITDGFADGGDDEVFQLRARWFSKSCPATKVEWILWGYSLNGKRLASVWLSDEIGWAVLVLGELPSEVLCLFKSPAAILRDVFGGRLGLGDVFPEAEGPFHFVPDAPVA